ncbi:MAG: hypothetical protein Q8M31_17220 [Beijerinckiaceae bacterium]|nr:hypothetical protein [Beijerinckiaceae bacterium]
MRPARRGWGAFGVRVIMAVSVALFILRHVVMGAMSVIMPSMIMPSVIVPSMIAVSEVVRSVFGRDGHGCPDQM